MAETHHHVALPDGYGDKMRELSADIRQVAGAMAQPHATVTARHAYSRALYEIAEYQDQLAGAFEGRFDG